MGNYHFELVSGIIRLYKDGESYKAGDKYIFCCTLVMITPELAELRAVESMPGAAADYREVLRLLENMGFKEFQYYRKKKGKTIKKQFKLCNLTH